MKQKKLNRVGIDVSAKELVVKIERKGVLLDGVTAFENNKSGHKKLVKFITKYNTPVRVCMEATGIYHFELALLLYNTENVDVMVLNPKVIKHFAIANMKRAKNDPLDAQTILEYLKCMAFTPWQAPDEKSLKLQAISRRMHQLKAELQRESCRIHLGGYSDILAATISNDIAVNIKHLKKRISLLEEKAMGIIQSCGLLSKKYNLLISVKGIATTSAIQILSELICLPNDMRAEQWVAYAGLDPRAFESGSSVKKSRRISKAGNKYLRTALYMPSWVAVQSEPAVTAFYEKLIQAGKKPMQAIVAVMRKLLHAIWGILNSETSWNPEKFYSAKKV